MFCFQRYASDDNGIVSARRYRDVECTQQFERKPEFSGDASMEKLVIVVCHRFVYFYAFPYFVCAIYEIHLPRDTFELYRMEGSSLFLHSGHLVGRGVEIHHEKLHTGSW